MYIKKKPIASSDFKPKSLHNLISIIQYTMAAPKGLSHIYDQFFEILSKTITIQMKLFESSSSTENFMPKYKKYLETKISSFINSIRQVNNSEKSPIPKSPIKTLSRGSTSDLKKTCLFNQEIIKKFRKISQKKEKEKVMNKSSSMDNSINNSKALITSNRAQCMKRSYFADTYTDENNKSGAILYPKGARLSINYQDYSTIPNEMNTSFYSTHFVNKTKSKSILKNFSTNNFNQKKNSVTFKDNSTISILE